MDSRLMGNGGRSAFRANRLAERIHELVADRSGPVIAAVANSEYAA